ncbi:MAG: hypothetical protein O3A02_00315 [bacterium]|nr:hypothetical protein [bacterium]
MRTLTRLLMSTLVLVGVGVAAASNHGGTLRLAITQDEGTLTPYTYHPATS